LRRSQWILRHGQVTRPDAMEPASCLPRHYRKGLCMMWILAILLAVLVGLSLGLFGSGGSVLAVPILVYVLGIETKSAIAMSLAIVGFTALTGTVAQWRQKTLCLKAAVFFSLIGILGTLGGTW